MGRKHIVLFVGACVFAYFSYVDLPHFRDNPVYVLLDLGSIVLITFGVLFLIYLGEK